MDVDGMTMSYPWVVNFHGRLSRTGTRKHYYYFRRPGFPIVRIRAKPGTPKFDAFYDRLIAAETKTDFRRIRQSVGMSPKPQPRPDYSKVDAFIARCEEQARRKGLL
jgi:hypothetical protein